MRLSLTVLRSLLRSVPITVNKAFSIRSHCIQYAPSNCWAIAYCSGFTVTIPEKASAEQLYMYLTGVDERDMIRRTTHEVNAQKRNWENIEKNVRWYMSEEFVPIPEWLHFLRKKAQGQHRGWNCNLTITLRSFGFAITSTKKWTTLLELYYISCISFNF